MARLAKDGGRDASDELTDAEFVGPAAVATHWDALGHVSERLRNDKHVMLATVAQNGVSCVALCVNHLGCIQEGRVSCHKHCGG